MIDKSMVVHSLHVLHWKVKSRGPEGTSVLLFGEITEAASFGELKLLRGRVILDLAGVKRINSFGVREFLDFLESLRRSCDLEAERCSTAIVTQLNMLPELSRRIRVRSFLAPLECPKCTSETEVTVESRSRATTRIPHTVCDECGTTMVLAEPEDRYLAFLDN